MTLIQKVTVEMQRKHVTTLEQFLPICVEPRELNVNYLEMNPKQIRVVVLSPESTASKGVLVNTLDQGRVTTLLVLNWRT